MEPLSILCVVLFVALLAVSAALVFLVRWLNAEIAPRKEMPRDAAQAERLSCFSLNYFEARRKFRQAAKAIPGMKLSSHLVLMDDEDTGMELTIESAVLEGNGSDVFVHMSGTHGVEGFAGSAIQIAVLRAMAKNELKGFDANNSNNKGSRPTIVFIHAVNPYGMHHNRRFNQDNIDLNRACISKPEHWAELLDRPANFTGYEDVRPLFEAPVLRKEPNSMWDLMLFVPRMLPTILWHGVPKLKRTLVTGQYHHQEGIIFGGKGGLPRNWQIVRDVLTPILQGARSVVAIDVHSGLGPSGVDTMMCGTDAEYALAAAMYPTGCLLDYPGLHKSKKGGKKDGAASGYDDAKGFAAMGTFLTQEQQDKMAHCFTVAQEFGTRDPVRVGVGVMLENQAFWTCRHTPLHRLAGHISRGSFYVETIEWKESVWARGMQRFEQTLEWFNKKK